MLPRTLPLKSILSVQMRVRLELVGVRQVVPRSIVDITVRFLLLAIQPTPPAKWMSEICPCMVWDGKNQVPPLSTLRRMNPPPPPM